MRQVLLFGMLLAIPAMAERRMVTWDCTCDESGYWQAACPTAVGIHRGGYREPGINIRRCRALNPASGEAVCTPGQRKNIYTSPAPAIVNPCYTEED